MQTGEGGLQLLIPGGQLDRQKREWPRYSQWVGIINITLEKPTMRSARARLATMKPDPRAKLTRMPFDLRDHPLGFLTPIQVPDATVPHDLGTPMRDYPSGCPGFGEAKLTPKVTV